MLPETERLKYYREEMSITKHTKANIYLVIRTRGLSLRIEIESRNQFEEDSQRRLSKPVCSLRMSWTIFDIYSHLPKRLINFKPQIVC